LRDLFEADEGGWLQDPALLTRLVEEKLAAARDTVLAQGWKWVEAAVEISYGTKQGMLHATPLKDALSKKDVALVEKLSKEHDQLTEEHPDDDMPEPVRARLEEIETDLNEFENRPAKYDPEDIARGGVFITIGHDGRLSITYGYIRPEDMLKTPEDSGIHATGNGDADGDTDGMLGDDGDSEDSDGAGKPIPESLTQYLTSYRTVALRDALAQNFDVAFVAMLHAMCLDLFYHASPENVLQVTVRSDFPANAPGLGEWQRAKDVDKRHAAWKAKLPRASQDVWQTLQEMDNDSRALLFAHCASMTVNAVRIPHMRRPEVMRNADRLATALGLDMVQAGWTPTAETYLGRGTKAHILDAVREAKGESSAQLLDHLKKPEMVKEAARLLDGSGWLPQVLRNTEQLLATASPEAVTPPAPLPDFLDRREQAA
jgi:ParB family chromosome partitioning protein